MKAKFNSLTTRERIIWLIVGVFLGLIIPYGSYLAQIAKAGGK